MAYADLTAEQQAVLDDFCLLVRQWCMEEGKVGALATEINGDYNNRVLTILNELVDGDEIPNRSGLDGSETLTKSELVNLISYLQGHESYNTAAHRSNMAKGCGARNMLRG